METYPVRLLSYFVAAGWLGVAGGCQSDATPAAGAGPLPRLVARAATRPPAAIDTADTTTARQLLKIRRFVADVEARPRRAWSRVQRKELYESTEGGEALFYYQHQTLQKVAIQYLGETGQQRTTYYLRADQPCLVVKQQYQYNRPITYDSAAMRENGDTEVFDLAKSVITTTRSYFAHGQLVYQTGGPVRDSVARAGYRQREQRRLASGWRALRLPAGSPKTGL